MSTVLYMYLCLSFVYKALSLPLVRLLVFHPITLSFCPFSSSVYLFMLLLSAFILYSILYVTYSFLYLSLSHSLQFVCHLIFCLEPLTLYVCHLPLACLSSFPHSRFLSLAFTSRLSISSLSLPVTCMSVFISSLSLSVTCLSVSISSLSLSVPHMSFITRLFSVCHLLVCLYNLSLSLYLSLTCLSSLPHFLSIFTLSLSVCYLLVCLQPLSLSPIVCYFTFAVSCSLF